LVKRGKRLIYSISTRYIALEYGGAFLIYLTLDPKKISFARRELINFLKTSWSFNYSKEDFPPGRRMNVTDYLETAKNRIKFSHQRFRELGLNAAITYARYILFHESHQADEEPYMVRVEKVKSRDLRDAASNYFSGKPYVMVSVLPGGGKEEDKKIRR
jgi:predicted Zn-dependent peptidase